eukprot:291501-Pyramimonas_sp.AAC.1
MPPILPGVLSAMCARDLARSSRESNCFWSLGMRWFSDCRTCCTRDAPTPKALNEMAVSFRKLWMLKPTVSAS